MKRRRNFRTTGRTSSQWDCLIAANRSPICSTEDSGISWFPLSYVHSKTSSIYLNKSIFSLLLRLKCCLQNTLQLYLGQEFVLRLLLHPNSARLIMMNASMTGIVTNHPKNAVQTVAIKSALLLLWQQYNSKVCKVHLLDLKRSEHQ